MKVIILYNTAWYIYNFRSNLIRSLQEQGCVVTAVCPYDSSVEKLRAMGVEHENLDLRSRGVNPLAELSTVIKLWRILHKVQPDFVLSYTVKCNVYAGLCRQAAKFKQIANVSGLGEAFERKGLLYWIVCSLYRLSLKGAQRVFFQNRQDCSFCIARNLVPAEAASVLPGSGVDLERFSRARREDSFGLRKFLMFGRLLPAKGYDEFMQAAKYLRSQFGQCAEFWILGMQDSERPESARLHERVQCAAAEGWIRYWAGTDDVLPYLHAADAVVLPSYYNEGIPRSLLEAMAAAKPVITTDWKGCRETVEEGENGFRVPVKNLAALIEALRAMVFMPPKRLREMGRRSRELAEAKFDERMVISAYLIQLGLEPLTLRETQAAYVEERQGTPKWLAGAGAV